MLLTNCPSYTLSLEQGLELMWEEGEPMECGIFDFYKVFSRAFGEEEDGAGGNWSGRWGVPLTTPDFASLKSGACSRYLVFYITLIFPNFEFSIRYSFSSFNPYFGQLFLLAPKNSTLDKFVPST